ncbi:MAG: glycosyltransferase family 4 protein [Deferrisomatales bacterium]
MRVLTFTSLFPNAVSPNLGGFIARRMEAWAERHATAWAVAAPVPYFPRLPVRTGWDAHARVPRAERRGRWPVLHPRYFMLPKVGLRFQGASMAQFARGAVARLQREEGPFDLVDAHFVYPDGYAALRLARELGIPCVVSARGTDIHLYPELPGIGSKIRAVLSGADAVVGVSEALAGRMRELGAPAERTFVVSNGVDGERFHPREEASRGVPARSLLAVGNLVPEKGFDLLLEAVARLGAEYSDLKVTVAGGGSERARLEAQAERLGLGGRVRFLGPVPHDELPRLYREAGAFVLPSRREGCPNVVLEALASGLPVCATAVGGVLELVDPDRNGVLASASTVAELVEALRSLFSRPWDPAAIRGTVLSHSWEAVADRLGGVFRDFAGDAGRRG